MPITKKNISLKSFKPISVFGVTLLELLIVLAVISVLASIAIPSYHHYILKGEIAVAKTDIVEIEARITQFYVTKLRYPLNTAELGGLPKDPWGNPYIFLNFEMISGKGKKRKDKNLVPINTEYDLYSMGPDGQSVSPLTAKQSRDDIIRANNGSFIGSAEDY